jgi:4-diphosphocytidyl-2-C-methyl-D-erythritol kinase
MIAEFAPAKINLYLHVGPVRRDGLHELRSLFAFVGDGDRVVAHPSRDLTLELRGPFAASLAGEDVRRNLVYRAALALREAAGVRDGAAMVLEKNLPIAAGVGGGSADAAAALRALVRLWKLDISAAELRRLAFSLGADVPACLDAGPALVSGAGERIAPGPRMAPLHVTLVNPRVAMPTGPIFRAFDAQNAAPRAPEFDIPRPATIEGAVAMLAATRNDLQPFAISRAPVVGETLRFLGNAPGALGARMSGSGATAFGLFSSAAAATRAAQKAQARGWWAAAAPMLRGAQA